jgi:hypothetical protein
VTDDEQGQGPGESPSGAPGPEDIGSVAEEAAKLFGALSGWAKEHGDDLGQGFSGVAAGAAHAMRDVNEHVATGADECRYCPVCRGIHTIRELSPEVKTHLAVAGASLMQAAAALMATAVPDQAKAAARDADIEKIDVDEDWPEE